MTPPLGKLTTRVSLTWYDLEILELACRGYLDGLDGDYDEDHIHMDALRMRLHHLRFNERNEPHQASQ